MTLRRGSAVLKLLAKYGTLSSISIRTMLDGCENHRALAKVMARLASYFQISQGVGVQKVISDLTGIPARELDQKRLRFTHFAHEDLCAKLQFAIEREIPGVITIREWEINRKQVPELVIPPQLRQARFLPDLVVAVPTRWSDPAWTHTSFRWLAIEIERSRKKMLRVYSKLKTYATECGFDGLLYMIPEEVLLENYLNHFEAEVAPKALRVRSFKDAFFARSLLPKDGFELSNVALDCGRQHLSLKRWIDFMASTSQLDRAEKWSRLRALSLPET
jgi:hypothetical protein